MKAAAGSTKVEVSSQSANGWQRNSAVASSATPRPASRCAATNTVAAAAEPEQQRRERSLDGVPEQEPVEHEQLDGERLVALPHPRNLLDAALALEQLGHGRVVVERVRRRDRRGRHEHVGDDVDSDQRGERELPRAASAESRQPRPRADRASTTAPPAAAGTKQRQVRGGVEQPEPAGGEREQRERDRAGAEAVERVERTIAAAPERREHGGAGAQPRERRRTGERDVRERLSQGRRRSAAAASA